MKLLFFDCETNGKPVAYGKSYSDVDNWPRVTQLAWIIADQDGNILKSAEFMIKPDGWVIPQDDFFVRNGMTTERCEEQGVALEGVLDLFMASKQECDVLVAHNLSFDHAVVWAEYIRAGRQPRSGMAKICTMQKSTAYCQVPYPSGRKGNKWPTLEELHLKLFGRSVENAHDALADIMATRDCFFELVKRGVIELPTIEKEG